MTERDKFYEEKLNQYEGLVRYFANKYKIKGYERDDLEQEYRMLLISALDQYDDTRSASFETYYTSFALRWTSNAIRGSKRFKRDRLYLIDDVLEKPEKDDVLNEYIDEGKTPDELEKEGRVIEFVEECLREMKYGEYTRKILLDGFTATAVAKMYGVSQQSVQQQHSKNIERLKLLLYEHEYVQL